MSQTRAWCRVLLWSRRYAHFPFPARSLPCQPGSQPASGWAAPVGWVCSLFTSNTPTRRSIRGLHCGPWAPGVTVGSLGCLQDTEPPHSLSSGYSGCFSSPTCSTHGAGARAENGLWSETWLASRAVSLPQYPSVVL